MVIHSILVDGWRYADISIHWDISFKSSKKYIYHNENLFRTIDLRWVIYIRITFSHDFATLQPFPQNHIQDLASKTQIPKNSILRAMTFKIFLKINISLTRQIYKNRSAFFTFLRKSYRISNFKEILIIFVFFHEFARFFENSKKKYVQ